ncbi:AraC-type DNA-binding protein [Amphibacillus marinus]|uniref:AraC-type DNA-binding protein n=1 Tax=Amphibacillus marinus TaxID=872970 RepID=A0A1H8T1S4_9BACI|nr:AraC family transcriptional regulator [Amphibacillus marinus]SEO84548.1 AraC-type DNA-binding protein [Amphibacillus marinus]
MINGTMNDKINIYLKELGLLLGEFVSKDGINATDIPSLQLFRASHASEPLHAIYEPSLLLIVQGSKIVTLAEEDYQYDPTTYLVTSVHLPITGQIITATPDNPYLCIQINFTMDQILAIVNELNEVGATKVDSSRGIVINKVNNELLDAVLRLIRLLNTPKDIPFLSPSIIHEILYRVLRDKQGDVIKQFALAGSHAHNVAKVIACINRDYSKKMRMGELAKKVNMSTSSLHNQFKKVTAMTPLQYQKRMRLQEARRKLFSESTDAATVSFQVGYESPSQFSREYARLFGLPPVSDINRLKDSLTTDSTLI